MRTKNIGDQGGLKFLGYAPPEEVFFKHTQELENFYKKRKAEGASKEELEIISKTLEKMEKAKTLYLRIGLLIHAADEDKKIILDKLAEELAEQVEKMQEGETRIFPFGAMAGDIYSSDDDHLERHSTLLQITKQRGKYQIAIFNTGAGVTNHTKKGEKYYPFVIENIENNELTKIFFTGLIASSTKRDQPIRSQYEYLKKNLRGKVNPEPNISPYSTQNIDNCPHKCLTVWLHRALGSSIYDNYKEELTSNSLKAYKKRFKRVQEFSYPHGLLKKGVGRSNFLRRFATGFIHFFSSSSRHMRIDKQDLNNLLSGAQRTNEYLKWKKEIVQLKSKKELSMDESQRLKYLENLVKKEKRYQKKETKQMDLIVLRIAARKMLEQLSKNLKGVDPDKMLDDIFKKYES